MAEQHAEHQASHSDGKQLRLVVVTPETTLVDEMAEFVALPLFDGEIGIAPLHSPMIGRLGYGEMRVTIGGRTERYYLDGGFVQVADNVVSVLTNRALPATQLDAAMAEEQLKSARERPSNTAELMAIRDRAEMQARAQLRVARRAG
ncbi:MAG TPA: ATP synthase F1 subunit epsilon [Pirellulales bacterium]|nr:ATP synthase F1 subunit epsilon [Pirellulales bacterium]